MHVRYICARSLAFSRSNSSLVSAPVSRSFASLAILSSGSPGPAATAADAGSADVPARHTSVTSAAERSWFTGSESSER
jgi:hypothetical protein